MFGFLKKKGNLIQESSSQEPVVNEESIEDDISDDSLDRENKDFEDCSDNDKPEEFSKCKKVVTEENPEKIVEELNQEHNKSVEEFARSNSNQLYNRENITDMKNKKDKTFFGTITNVLKEQYYALKDSLKSSDEENQSVVQNTKTENEINYKGLNKNYIYIVIGIFFLIVFSGLLFGNDEPEKPPVPQQPAQEVGGLKSYGSEKKLMLDIPQSYSDVNTDDDDKKKEEKKDKLVIDGKKESNKEGTAKTAPTPPSVPKQPQSKEENKVSKEELEEYKFKKAALSSDISFKIANDGVK